MSRNRYGRLMQGVALLALLVVSVTGQGTVDSTTEFTLPNQLKTIHRRVDGNEVVAVQIYFRGGARNITAQNAGLHCGTDCDDFIRVNGAIRLFAGE